MTNKYKRKLTMLLIELGTNDFEIAVERRQETSTANKDLHQRVLNAIMDEDIEELEEALYDPWYFYKPLLGVIHCMNIDVEDKQMMIDAYEEIDLGET